MRTYWNHSTPKGQPAPTDNTSNHIKTQVRAWENSGKLIHPEIALELSAWFQSPEDDYGMAFATFASTGTIVDDLLDAIDNERYFFISGNDFDTVKNLDALKAYILAVTKENSYA